MKNTDIYKLSRFIVAQESQYDDALNEIKSGKKKTHWMWFIFPQLQELGYSGTAKYYGITCYEEAREYLKEPVLNNHLIEICNALLELESNNAEEILGWPDHLKLKSSMTLFEKAAPGITVFSKVLEKFFNGERDSSTLKILGMD